ncbi:MAG: FHA domain-containing protein [Chloroflexi bacterium]|nr:FHA domain-containing protein [Chloroflexota bacterium]
MSNPLEYKVQDLFEAFVYMRRQGAAPDHALQELKRLRPIISTAEREQIANLIRQWEMNEGLHHPPNPGAKIVPPPPKPVPTPPADTTDITCPQCGKTNPHHAGYCYACGTLLIKAGAMQGTQQFIVEDEGLTGTTFGSLSNLILKVQGFDDAPIKLAMDESKEMIIGRTAADSVLVPDVDLTKYDGKDMGVSRVHATLRYRDTAITITDMGSVNHTYLNGERVYPQEVRVLRDGDELKLGRLIVRVIFERQLRRIRPS